MSQEKSPNKKPLKLFGKEYVNPTSNEKLAISGFLLFMFYGLILNYYAIGSAFEHYTDINKFVGFIIIFLTIFFIRKANFFGIGKDISKISWLTLNMIGIYCVQNYFDWPSYNTFALVIFSFISYVRILFFPEDQNSDEVEGENKDQK